MINCEGGKVQLSGTLGDIIKDFLNIEMSLLDTHLGVEEIAELTALAKTTLDRNKDKGTIQKKIYSIDMEELKKQAKEFEDNEHLSED
jgi:energy-converting hydrogenase Eha subunit H